MLNLDETLESIIPYLEKKNWVSKFLFCSLSVISFIELLREQVPEINLLQLIPGFYFLLLFSSLFYLFATSEFISSIPFKIDMRKADGTKTSNKIAFIISSKLTIFFLINTFLILVTNVLPLSLDSLNSYSQLSLESLWSFEEVLNLETLLATFLLLLSQSPCLVSGFLTTENDVNFLPQIWRIVVFFAVVVAGVITPTVDGFTQVNFSLAVIIFYIIIINIIEKRVTVKYIGLNSINS